MKLNSYELLKIECERKKKKINENLKVVILKSIVLCYTLQQLNDTRNILYTIN